MLASWFFFHLSVLSSEINREKIHYYTACTTNEVGFPTILQKKDKKCLRTG